MLSLRVYKPGSRGDVYYSFYIISDNEIMIQHSDGEGMVMGQDKFYGLIKKFFDENM